MAFAIQEQLKQKNDETAKDVDKLSGQIEQA